MSMSICILSDRKLSSMGAWQQAINIEGFPVRLPVRLPLSRAKGVLAIKFRNEVTAFECVPRIGGDVISEWKRIDFAHRWKFALELLWGGDVNAGISAYLAASAYAKVTNGLVLDCEEGKIISPQRAAEIGWEIEKSIPMIEAAVRKAVERFRK